MAHSITQFLAIAIVVSHAWATAHKKCTLMVKLALFEPDIPQNVGTLLRLSACLGVELHLIEPFGFVFDDKRLRRAGMDYIDQARYQRHASWAEFCRYCAAEGLRRVLVETGQATPYTAFTFSPRDVLLLGRESAGTPPEVMAACETAITIPMQPGARSLNVALSAAMVVGEALRQTQTYPTNI